MKFKSFNEVSSYLSSIENINRGGCGYAACVIYQFFKEKGKRPKIVFEYDPWCSYRLENKEAIENKTVNGASAPGHIFVKTGGRYYDATGEHKKLPAGWAVEYEQKVNYKFLEAAIKNRDTWNDIFERSEEVPKIEKEIGVSLPK